MEEGEMAVIDRNGIRMMSMSGELIERSSRRIDWSPVMAEKAGHKHFMHKEIFEQPRALGDTLRGRINDDASDVLLEPGLLERANQCNRIMLTACGTSWHSCLVGRMALEEMARIGCEVELASELRYRHPLLDENTLVVAVSQSGETADTLAAIREAKRLGSPVLSIVNVLDSSIARESDFVLYTHAGPEIGVASTKAFLTQVAVLLLFAVGLGRKKDLNRDRAAQVLKELRSVPLLIEQIPKARAGYS